MKHILRTAALAVLLLPGTVHAYVEPEDVLFGNEVAPDDELHGAASSQRSSRAVSSASSEDDLHGAAPDEGEYLTPREERILQRIENRQYSSVPTYQAPSDDTLHSGAPLAHTGPETAIALALLGIATVATVTFARAGRIDFTQK